VPWTDPPGPPRYTVFGTNLTVAGATTLVQVHTKAAADPQPPGYAIAIIHGWCAQSANATSAQQRIQWHVKSSVFPTLVSATPQSLRIGDPASGLVGATTGAVGTVGINASAEGAGAENVIYSGAFNVLNGWEWIAASQDEYIVLPPDTAVGLKFPTAPTTLTGWTFGLTYLEVSLTGYDL
jgi:hypothetical protein